MSKIWKPSPRQEQALLSTCHETLYGGARGGGKTDAGQVWLIDPDYIKHPRYRALVIRRNAEDLRDWIDRAEHMFYSTGGRAVGNPPEFKFPSGAVIRTGHLKDENAYTKYQGHEYHKMLIEELTQIASESRYLKLIASCRTSIPELKARVMCTTNPGEIGHRWVKKRFIDVAPPNTPYIDPITGRTRIFIPARVEDNPAIMKNDPMYIATLEGLPPNLRRAWRYGDWEDYEVDGAYYGKQMKEARHETRIAHVPYEPNLLVHTFWDLGVGDETAIWFAQQYNKEIRLIDYFSASGEGLPFYRKILGEKPYAYGDHWAPHDIQVRELGTGKSRIETARDLGINFKIVPSLPLEDGIEATRNILSKCWFDAKKCEEGINCLDNYHKEYDEKNRVFKNHPVHDDSSHGADAFRMLAVALKDDSGFVDPNALTPQEYAGDDSW